MTTFRDALAWASSGDQSEGSFDASWAQGRAVYGGVIGSSLLRAMRSIVPAERPTRSVHVDFVAPVIPGEPVRATVELLRDGKALTQVSAHLTQAGRRCALAFATFGAGRASAISVAAPPPPEVATAEASLLLPYVEGVTPAFTQHFALRWARGTPPFSGGTETGFSAYASLRTRCGPADDEVVLGLVDAWPAPVLSMLDRPTPASSVTWAIDLFRDASPFDATDSFLFDARTDAAEDGYASVRGMLYAPDGRAVARSSQLVAVFG